MDNSFGYRGVASQEEVSIRNIGVLLYILFRQEALDKKR